MDREATGIVVGYDGTPGSDVALDWAARTAARLNEPLRILVTVDPGTPPDDVAATATADLGVERAAALMDRDQVNAVTIEGSPSAQLVEASEGARVVVTGCRGRGRMTSGLLGSVSYAVTAHAHSPAVVVRGNETVVPDKAHRVVVGVDDSESSERALEIAADIAASAGATLNIVRVEHMRSGESFAYAETSEAGDHYTRSTRAEGETTIEGAEKRARAAHPDLTVESEVLFGDPGKVLPQLGQHAGLIVVGSRGRGGFAGLVLGSVSHKVIHDAESPVMVVRA
jgi:nucleotide-binding universal stress UspA family protein